MFELFALAEREGYGVYLLGAKQEALDAATGELQRRYPALRVAGTRHGYFGPDEEPQVVREVADAKPEILFVALPSPRKELFLIEHATELGAGFAMGVGGSIDVLAGIQPRAPLWMQRAGLEWLHRLLRDPSGMWRRYLVTNSRFVALLGKALLRRPPSRVR